MAEVRLGLYEIESKNLPAVCMCCGAAADEWVTRKFTWRPSEFFSLGETLRTMTVALPFCARHRRHWSRRNTANVILLPLFILSIFGLILVGVDLVKVPQGTKDALLGILCGGMSLSCILLFGVNIVFDAISIKPTEITERSITLKRVSEVFAEAVQQSRANLKPRSAKS